MKVIEELYVSIEEFDYELKENGCLQLLADISITGLCDEERIEDEEEEEERRMLSWKLTQHKRRKIDRRRT